MNIPIWAEVPLFILLLIGFLYASIIFLKQLAVQRKIKTKGTLVEAVIVDYEKRNELEGISFHPIVKFTTLEGENIMTVSSNGYLDTSKRGKRIWIAYLNSDPTQFVFQKDNLLIGYFLWIIFSGTSLYFITRELFNRL